MGSFYLIKSKIHSILILTGRSRFCRVNPRLELKIEAQKLSVSYRDWQAQLKPAV